MIYSGSSCWAHLKEKIIERRSKMSVKAECYQPTFPPACLFRVVGCFCYITSCKYRDNKTVASTFYLEANVCKVPPYTSIRTNTHTDTHTKKKEAFARGAHGVINCLSGAATGFMDRIRLQV